MTSILKQNTKCLALPLHSSYRRPARIRFSRTSLGGSNDRYSPFQCEAL